MAAVSQITANLRHEINIVVHPWYRDHCFAGKIILPGVESLIILAHEVRKIRPECNIRQMFDVRFDKILELNPDESKQAVIIEINEDNNESITAKLLTKSRRKTISRLKEHGRVSFRAGEADSYPSRAADLSPQEPVLTIPAQTIYQELVPFGPAYQNIIADLRLTKRGAWAGLRAPDLTTSEITALTGSPFPLDAAFHAACVWGQRFGGFIPFPVGFSSRTIINNTKPGETYRARVIPIALKTEEIIFDLWIFDQQGKLFESVSATRMRDISGGRMKPPSWIIADQFV
ncbi:polyketide synthase dehydratase domain-containing protein [Desulfobacterota bacterium M19]